MKKKKIKLLASILVVIFVISFLTINVFAAFTVHLPVREYVKYQFLGGQWRSVDTWYYTSIFTVNWYGFDRKVFWYQTYDGPYKIKVYKIYWNMG